MDIKEVFEICKNSLGNDIKYVRRLDNGSFEAHEVKQRTIIKYVFEIKENKMRILLEIEERI
ncbi:MAG: hypothetical protein ACM3KR_05860 [Deltaproteobacteria bacterium]